MDVLRKGHPGSHSLYQQHRSFMDHELETRSGMSPAYQIRMDQLQPHPQQPSEGWNCLAHLLMKMNGKLVGEA